MKLCCPLQSQKQLPTLQYGSQTLDLRLPSQGQQNDPGPFLAQISAGHGFLSFLLNLCRKGSRMFFMIDVKDPV